jgi:hypothetical protein
MSASNPQTSTRVVVEDSYEPGNATRYDLALIEPEWGGNYRLLLWLNAPGGGRAMRLHVDGIVHIGYLAEKLDYRNVLDLRAILRWLDTRGVNVYLD